MLQAFKGIAPYLSNPLVLVGFVLMLFYGVHRSLLNAKIIPPLTSQIGGEVVLLFLRFGFWIALLVTALGFGLAFYREHTATELSVSVDRQRAELAEQAKAMLEKRLADTQRQLSAADSRVDEFQEQSKTLVEAVNALAQQSGPGIDEALIQLAEGDTAAAKAIFLRVIQAERSAVKNAATAWRHLGALAYLDDTGEALQAYRRATELDPENASGWGHLGMLLHRNGDWPAAESAHQKVAELGKSSADRSLLANAYIGQGIICQSRGDLNEAEAMYKRGLAIDEDLGRKDGIAVACGNLGNVYRIRGDLEKAEAMYRKSLTIDEGLGRREGMTDAYGNLGIVYETRGDLKEAETMIRKSLTINMALGRKESLASDYTNLGINYLSRNNLEEAEDMYQKSLSISEDLGHKEGMGSTYSNLGNLYKIKRDLKEAEVMHRKSLAIFESLGSKEGMAHAYGNLGNVFRLRNNLEEAEAMYQNSLALFQEVGAAPQIRQAQKLLRKLREY